MQLPVLGCTFLTLSDCEESTAENRQLSEQASAPIIRALMISALMIGAQQCHPPASPTFAQQCAHLCPAVNPPVPPTCAHQCSPSVLPVSAQRLCQSVPSSCASQCLAVPPVSATYQCRLSVTPH
ncbi:unnamed protein product [Staurois parvus]|uniref:Uncharacterized protein n=1 Tax=Staurois parvus TaxID=386267 RepID=A0ABN9DSG4_9NEOB|nr:unnamed protein product [Staurois parvus]